MWLAVEVDSLLIGLAMPIAVALIIGAITLVRRRNNKTTEILDIGGARANRVPVSFWVERFDAIHKEGEVILRRQDQILEHQGRILQELVIIKTILTSRIEHRESL